MKNALVICVAICLSLAAAGANASMTWNTGDKDLGTGGSVNCWNLRYDLAPGEYITGAVLTYQNLKDDMAGYASDHLYTHLLDNPVGSPNPGWAVIVGSGDSVLGDYYSGQGVLVGDYTPPDKNMHNVSYNLVSMGLLTDLTNYIANNGRFAFGVDADCHWQTCNVRFVLDTATRTIPAPGAVLLAGLGCAAVGWLRSRRAL